ncbi:MAG: hypothetical protein F9K40_00610 [Kofleriaceae bacterium]|nr:MAG: hypothetical protein F9K40_00610 [Kofleriaceae bacterium]
MRHDLSEGAVEMVVVHQDLHGGNILRAEREPWLVIDPKRLLGSARSTSSPSCETAARCSPDGMGWPSCVAGSTS